MSAALAVPQPAPPNPRVGLDLTEGSPRELMLLLNIARRGAQFNFWGGYLRVDQLPDYVHPNSAQESSLKMSRLSEIPTMSGLESATSSWTMV